MGSLYHFTEVDIHNDVMTQYLDEVPYFNAKNFFGDFWNNKVDGRVFDRCITDFSIAQNLGSVESMVFDYGPKKWRGKTVPSSDGNLLRTYSIIGWKFPFPAYYSEVSGIKV